MTTLYDSRGKKIRPGSLSKEQASGSIMSIRTPYDENVAIGMTPARLISLIRNAKEGNHFDYLTLAQEMEERDTHFFSNLQTRKLATAQLEISVQPVSEDAQDLKEAKAVEDLIVKTACFRKSITEVLDAINKGFSVVEMLWYKKPDIWTINQFLFRKQRWFEFDRETAQELHLYDGSATGVPLDPFKYVIHRPNIFCGTSLASGLARPVAAYHLFKSFAIRDWMAFAEVFGIPIRIGRYDTEATEDDKEALREAVRDIGSDAAAIIPKSVEIEFVRSAQSGFAGSDSFFPSLTGWINKEISKAVLGQTMTTEDGSSLAQAKVHEEVRKDIRNADARQLEDTYNRDMVTPFVALNFGVREGETQYPRLQFDTSEPEDLASLATALPPFIDRGLRVAAASIMEKFKLREPDANDLVLGPMVKAAPPDGNEDTDEESETEQGSSPVSMALLSEIDGLVHKTTNLRVFKSEYQEILQRYTRGRKT